MADPLLPTVDATSITILKILLKGKVGDEACVNTFYFMGVTPSIGVTATEMDTALTSFNAQYMVGLTEAVSDKVVWSTLECTNMTQLFMAASTKALVAASSTGLRTGEALPPQDALLFNRKTLFAGRHGRGSIRLPGISEDDQVNGVVTAAALKAKLDFLRDTVFMTDIAVTVGGAPVAFSPCLARIDPEESPVVRAALVKSWRRWNEISSQNSRKIHRVAP